MTTNKYEQGSNDAEIEEAAEKNWNEYSYTDYGSKLYGSVYKDAFKAGAKHILSQSIVEEQGNSEDLIVTFTCYLKDELWGFSQLRDGRSIEECKDEIIDLLHEDIGSVLEVPNVEIKPAQSKPIEQTQNKNPKQ